MSLRKTVAAGVATLWVLFLLLGSPAGAGADPLPECTGRSLYVVAHEDDSLIFQSPALLQEIRSGRCIQTVYLTAGDAGKDASYWEAREAGNEAAYAQMAGVADQWTQTTTNVGGHPISTETLDGQPRLSLVYLRLPDGNITGEGFPAYGNQSLLKLWRSANPGGGPPPIASITAVDGSTTYSYAELIATLSALIAAYQPQLIATQNYAAGLPPSFPGFDHPDHLVTAYMVRSAQESYAAAHQLIAYKGYDVSNDPQNVTGTLLGAKQLAFYTYGAHDPETCVDEASCSTTLYGGWLKRQVRTATATTGVVADAGYAQEVMAGTKVSLDGSASSAAGGKPLTYAWTQTKGPPVSLSSATAAKPSFTVPAHPTLLRFALVVSDGTTQSAASETIVRVPSGNPTPHADAGPNQAVAGGATVQLDGSRSWDPNSEPLQYAWLQTGGPKVTLAGAGTATPSFSAPAVTTNLTFSLTVTNGDQVSAPANVQVAVQGTGGGGGGGGGNGGGGDGGGGNGGDAGSGGAAGGGQPSSPPPARSRPQITAAATIATIAGRKLRASLSASGEPVPTLALEGRLPAGLTFAPRGGGRASLAGRAREAGTSRLTLVATNEAGRTTQALTVVVDPRPHLSKARLQLPVGRKGKKVVRVRAAKGSKLRCRGRLPRGARCQVLAKRRIAVKTTPKLKRAGKFRLEVAVTSAGGTATTPLLVRFHRP